MQDEQLQEDKEKNCFNKNSKFLLYPRFVC